MSKRKIIAVAFAVALALTAAYTHAAQDPRHVNYLTFNHAMAVPGATLPPGVYTFEIENPDVNLRAVSVTSRDGARRYIMQHTRPARRPVTLGRNEAVTLGEARPGAPVPILGWFPIGVNNGYEFVY